jgi:hypothetical protein
MGELLFTVSDLRWLRRASGTEGRPERGKGGRKEGREEGREGRREGGDKE